MHFYERSDLERINMHIETLTVYGIKNVITNRIYIGRTGNLSTRIDSHFNALKNGKHPNELMQSDYDQYGEDSFVVRIIDYIENQTAFLYGPDFDGTAHKTICRNENLKERYWMHVFDSTNPEHGYNYKDPAISKKSFDDFKEYQWR